MQSCRPPRQQRAGSTYPNARETRRTSEEWEKEKRTIEKRSWGTKEYYHHRNESEAEKRSQRRNSIRKRAPVYPLPFPSLPFVEAKPSLPSPSPPPLLLRSAAAAAVEGGGALHPSPPPRRRPRSSAVERPPWSSPAAGWSLRRREE